MSCVTEGINGRLQCTARSEPERPERSGNGISRHMSGACPMSGHAAEEDSGEDGFFQKFALDPAVGGLDRDKTVS